MDVRVIAATNSDLAESVRRKTFRSDLYYRLNVVMLHLPSLRERPEDIPLLADYFLQQFAKDNRCEVTAISPEALDALQNYEWPGNVRELQNAVERAATLACEPQIQVSDLPKAMRPSTASPSFVQSAPESVAISAAESALAPTNGKHEKEHLFSAKNSLVGDFERRYVTRLLVQNGFNISKAAAAAGCHRRTLYRMVHRYQIDLQWLQKERGVIRQNRRRKPAES